ncbi:MAG: hypothetical protein OXM02_02935 [Bacteroidota bacterium]|nr:hypothetical protein [Bacteroidota bacterium]
MSSFLWINEMPLLGLAKNFTLFIHESLNDLIDRFGRSAISLPDWRTGSALYSLDHPPHGSPGRLKLCSRFRSIPRLVAPPTR